MKERVAFDESEEQPMYKTALMTATAEWLSAPVGKGLTPGEAAEPEAAAILEQGLGFRLLVKGMTKRVGAAKTARV